MIHFPELLSQVDDRLRNLVVRHDQQCLALIERALIRPYQERVEVITRALAAVAGLR